MPYLKPPWFTRTIFNKIAMTFSFGPFETLIVTKRVSRQPQKIPVTPIQVDSVKYLVSAYGETEWVKNVRATPDIKLGGVDYAAAETPVDARKPILGRVQRAAIRSTALSQHCPCGARVSKNLAQRTHYCTTCGLQADRDIVSAALAACVEFTNPDDPATARVDYKLAHALRAGLASQQEARAQSTGTGDQRDHPAGSARAGSHRMSGGLCWVIEPPLGLPPNRPATKPDVTGPAETPAKQAGRWP